MTFSLERHHLSWQHVFVSHTLVWACRRFVASWTLWASKESLFNMCTINFINPGCVELTVYVILCWSAQSWLMVVIYVDCQMSGNNTQMLKVLMFQAQFLDTKRECSHRRCGDCCGCMFPSWCHACFSTLNVSIVLVCEGVPVFLALLLNSKINYPSLLKLLNILTFH